MVLNTNSNFANNNAANPYARMEAAGNMGGRMTPLEAEGARLGGMANRGTLMSGDQRQAMDLYQQAALGQGPSAAQAMLRQATDANVANQLSMAAASRGGNLGAAERGAAIAGMGAQAQGAQALAVQRAAEQQAAMQGYGAMASDVQGQILGNNLAYEQMLQQHTQAQRGFDDAYKLGDRALDMQAKKQMWDNILGLGQLTASTVGTAMGGASMSDERVKRNIQPGGMAATQAVGELQPATFEYKPGFGGPGQRVGIMAQDLEKTPAGASLVMNTPYGKAVDNGGLAALGVAAASENTHQLRAQAEEIEALKGQLVQLGGQRPPGVALGSTITQQQLRAA